MGDKSEKTDVTKFETAKERDAGVQKILEAMQKGAAQKTLPVSPAGVSGTVAAVGAIAGLCCFIPGAAIIAAPIAIACAAYTVYDQTARTVNGYGHEQFLALVDGFKEREDDEEPNYAEMAEKTGIDIATLQEWYEDPAMRNLVKGTVKATYNSWKDGKLNKATGDSFFGSLFGWDYGASSDDFRVLASEMRGDAHDGVNVHTATMKQMIDAELNVSSPIGKNKDSKAPGGVDAGSGGQKLSFGVNVGGSSSGSPVSSSGDPASTSKIPVSTMKGPGNLVL